MTPIERPLHVQVAEALGWQIEQFMTAEPRPTGAGFPPGSKALEIIPHYDTDWSATGPFIEKYGFWLRQLDQTLSGPQPWDAFRNDDLTFPRGFGPTPLLAVCNLIVRLAEAGILKAAEGR